MAHDSTPPVRPSWPADAGDRPPGEPRDGWLVAAGVVYPVAAFAYLLFGDRRFGPIAFGPEVILLPAIVVIAVAVGAKLQGVSLRWATVAAFVGWVAVVAFAELCFWSAAVASV